MVAGAGAEEETGTEAAFKRAQEDERDQEGMRSVRHRYSEQEVWG